MDDDTTRRVDYAVRVVLEALRTAQLKQLLAIVGGSPYDGRASNGALVLESKR
jgi:hypothetical protein